MTTKKDEKLETKETTKKETPKKEATKSKNINTIIETLEKFNLRELNDLVKNIEEHFDIKASAPVALASAPTDNAASTEGPSEVKITLTEVGTSKLAVIKAIMPITGAKSLIDAKKIVDKLPAIIKEKVPSAEAEKIVKELTDLGAVVKTE